MVLKTLDVPGPQRGFGIARRSEKISGEQLAINQETLYPLLLRREREGGDRAAVEAFREQSAGARLPADAGGARSERCEAIIPF
jgi:DNA-binding PadR family transcriptional regulator